ncbi:MAG: polysaccharide pyruvyl transferase family protein [Longimicrobiales bacterium]
MTASEARQPSVSNAGDASGPHYLLLTGAKLNAGDFLIRHRCKQLLRMLRPDARLSFHDRWRPLDPEQANAVDAIILAGGPALQPRLYPGVYPLTDTLDRIRPPIIAWGLGWKGIPGDEWTERTYGFTSPSRFLLERVQRDGWPIACRDRATARVLHRAGFGSTVVTGDPAWYHFDRLGQPFRPLRTLRSVVLSVPASPDYFPQAHHLARRLRESHDRVQLLCAFNHGWTPGPHLPEGRARALAALRDELERDGFAVADLSGTAEGLLELPDRSDLHVGYRLHAHLLFLSHRRPSLLVEEDGRGRAAGEALGLPGVPAWRRTVVTRAALEVVLRAARRGGRLERAVQGRTRPADRTVEHVLAELARHYATGYRDYQTVGARIDEAYVRAMKPFVESLP